MKTQLLFSFFLISFSLNAEDWPIWGKDGSRNMVSVETGVSFEFDPGEMSDDERDKIIEVINAQKGHKGFHDLRTRRSGRKVFIQMHLELEKSLNLEQAHDIADKVEDELRALYSQADVIVHQDPA